MKQAIIVLLFTLLTFKAKGQTNTICMTTGSGSISNVSSQICQSFTVRVYIHRVKTSSYGYGAYSGIDGQILQNLNQVYNKYGISFVLAGSRDWIAPPYISPQLNSGNITNILGVFTDTGNFRQSNAINIYVLPSDDPATISQGGGKADNVLSNAMVLFGQRPVLPCGSNNPSNTNTYIIPTSRVVAHEMGHCLGLSHTFENNGDDGLSDTPIDFVTSNSCINKSDCQFIANCSACSNLTPNPGLMTNVMSYTVAPCMDVFSPMQVDLMRYNLKNSLSNCVAETTLSGPNLSSMTMGTNSTLYTFNSVPTGIHYLFTYTDLNLLTSDINWTKTSGSSNSWGFYGIKNQTAWFSLSSGQNITLQVSAQDICNTASRTLTFVAQSAYRIYSSPVFTESILVEFDNVEFLEALPQNIGIYNAENGKEDKTINVKELFESGYFVKNNTLKIDVAKVERGKKILRFMYSNGSENRKVSGQDVRTENIFIN